MSRNLRNATVAFSQQVLGALSGAVGIFFIARQVPGAKFQLGVVGFAIGFVGLFLAIQRMFDGAHVKRVSEGLDLARCNSTYALLNAVSTLAIVAAVMGVVAIWTEVLGRGFQTPLHIRIIEMVIVYQVLNSIGEFVRRTYEGQGNILMGQIILSVEHVLKGAAMVYVAFNGLEPFVDGGKDAFGIAMAYVVGAFALALVSIALLWGQPFGKPSWTIAKRYAVFALPTAITASLFLVNMNLPSVVIQLFWGSGEVGRYFAPQRYIQFLPALATAASTALFPVFSSLHARGRRDPQLVRQTIRYVSILLLPTVAASVVVPTGIVHVLLSDQFLDAAPVLALLAVGAYVDSVRRMLSTKLGGVDRPVEVTKAGLWSVGSNVVLSILLVAPALFGVPLLGLKAVGASLAVVVSQFFGMGAILRSARTHAGVTLPPLWRHAIMFATAAGVLYLYQLVVPQLSFRFWDLIFCGTLAVASVAAAGVLVGEIRREDRELFRLLLHPGEWARFFQQEGRRPGR